MIKKLKTDIIFFRSLKLTRVISAIIILIFSLHIYILPSAFALTIEEQAKKKYDKKDMSTADEFVRKTPERRDYNRLQQAKDPRLACLLSLIIPGGGHIYLKKDLKGIAFCSLSLAGYSSGGYYLYRAVSDDASESEENSKYIISGLLFVVAAIIHVVGIVEAYNDAIEINEKKFYYGKNRSKNPYIARLKNK